MNRRAFSLILLCIFLLVALAGYLYFILGVGKTKANAVRTTTTTTNSPLTTKERETNRPFAPGPRQSPGVRSPVRQAVQTILPMSPEPAAQPQGSPPPEPPDELYVSSAPTPPPAPVGLGDYAPFGRLIQCELVNAVDSSNMTTPLIGMVTHDLYWNGKIIVSAGSEVHGLASTNTVRERIGSEGQFTIVLYDRNNPGRGRELVVNGIALDMEKDAAFDSYSITDGSAGLRGDIIRTDKLADVKLFVATFLSGAAQAFGSYGTNILGGTQQNVNGSSAISGVNGFVVNPAADGVSSVLNRYADMIQRTIERDGFFIRVPPGKQFYLYTRQVLDLNKARIGGDRAREAAEDYQLERARYRRQMQGDQGRGGTYLPEILAAAAGPAPATRGTQNSGPTAPPTPTVQQLLNRPILDQTTGTLTPNNATTDAR
jgi:hypothetical protein